MENSVRPSECHPHLGRLLGGQGRAGRMDCGRAHLSMDVRSEWVFIFLTDMFRFLRSGRSANAVFSLFSAAGPSGC